MEPDMDSAPNLDLATPGVLGHWSRPGGTAVQQVDDGLLNLAIGLI